MAIKTSLLEFIERAYETYMSSECFVFFAKTKILQLFAQPCSYFLRTDFRCQTVNSQKPGYALVVCLFNKLNSVQCGHNKDTKVELKAGLLLCSYFLLSLYSYQ